LFITCTVLYVFFYGFYELIVNITFNCIYEGIEKIYLNIDHPNVRSIESTVGWLWYF